MDINTFIPKDNWLNRRRINDRLPAPIGYKADPNDITIWVPDHLAIYYIEEALDHLDNDAFSVREAAKWVASKINRNVSHTSIHNIWKLYREKDSLSLVAKANKERKKTLNKLPPIEKAKRALNRKVRGKRTSITTLQKKLDSIDEFQSKKQEELDLFSGLEEKVDPFEGQEVAFRPNDGPQSEFLESSEQQILYGGAAGGGKSYSLLADPMRYFKNSNFNGLLVRRTLDELRELISKSYILYKKIFPTAKWQEQKGCWTFPSGATLWMTYLNDVKDLDRYQGQSWCWIGFDELTHWPTPAEWIYLSSRLRTTDKTLPLSQRATSNPGGLGHSWVKRMFIDPAPSSTTFVATDIETNEELRYPKDHHKVELRNQPLFYRKFIPAKLKDNPYLWEDGRYEASLLALPETQRRQLLDGDWTLGEGAAFPEFRVANPFVVKPFYIPENWKRFRSCDYGYTTHSAVHWYAIDPIDETLIVYREYYVSKKTGRDLAKEILRLELNEKIMYGVLDSSVWQKRGTTNQLGVPGPSIAEEMISEGTRWRPADRSAGSRTMGKNRLHELLKLRVVGYDDDMQPIMRPGIVFFDTCRQIIADLPVIPIDPDGKDDIDERYSSDHAYDSIRYGIQSRPRGQSLLSWETQIVIPSYKPADSVFGY